MTRMLKVAFSFAILHLALVIGVAIWVATHTGRNPQAPMLWLAVGVLDFPAYIAIAPFGEKIQSLQHVDWVSQKTGSWITGEWEPFLAPFVAFVLIGTVWWFGIGSAVGIFWSQFLRRRDKSTQVT